MHTDLEPRLPPGGGAYPRFTAGHFFAASMVQAAVRGFMMRRALILREGGEDPALASRALRASLSATRRTSGHSTDTEGGYGEEAAGQDSGLLPWQRSLPRQPSRQLSRQYSRQHLQQQQQQPQARRSESRRRSPSPPPAPPQSPAPRPPPSPFPPLG